MAPKQMIRQMFLTIRRVLILNDKMHSSPKRDVDIELNLQELKPFVKINRQNHVLPY